MPNLHDVCWNQDHWVLVLSWTLKRHLFTVQCWFVFLFYFMCSCSPSDEDCGRMPAEAWHSNTALPRLEYHDLLQLFELFETNDFSSCDWKPSEQINFPDEMHGRLRPFQDIRYLHRIFCCDGRRFRLALDWAGVGWPTRLKFWNSAIHPPSFCNSLLQIQRGTTRIVTQKATLAASECLASPGIHLCLFFWGRFLRPCGRVWKWGICNPPISIIHMSSIHPMPYHAQGAPCSQTFG